MTAELQRLTDEALLNISGHITFIEDMLARYNPPRQVVDKVRKQTEAISARQHDHRLYLAVVGEFSSGKSTLINSLLRDRLLKSESRVTTASETRIQHGKELAIEVASFERPEDKFALRESQELVRSIPWLPGLGSTVREIIPQVTAENQLIGKVGRVTISHPSAFLAGGVVIIDTPGINATYSDHAQVTQRVVAEECDLALITIDATVPGTRVLFDYLNKYLKPYLHRCVFIVTKFDRIPAEEREEQSRAVRSRLEEALAMEGLPIMATAPRVVLDAAYGSAVHTDTDWVESFEATEQDLYNRICRQRVVIITERVVRLLSDVYSEVKAGVEATAANLVKEQAALTENTIRDLDGFILEVKSASREALNDALHTAKREIVRRVRGERDDALKNIRKDLEEKTVIDAIKTYLEDGGAAKRLEYANDEILSKVRRLSNRLQDEGRDAAKAIDDTFAAEYTKLAALGSADVKVERGFADGVQLNLSSSIGNALTASADMTKAENGLFAGGAVTGAVIGTFILPGIGSLIGGFLGAMFGGMFSPPIAEQRTKVMAALEPDLNRQFDDVETGAVRALETAHRAVCASLDDYADAYLSEYSNTVDELCERHDEQARGLQSMQQAAGLDIAEIDRRRFVLQAIARKLID